MMPLLVPDFGKVAGDLELHPLVRCNLLRTLFPHTFVKIRDRSAQRAGDLEQSSGGDAIGPALIFVSLLIADPDHLGELLLG